MPKLNSYSLKKFEKLHGIVTQKLGYIDKKVKNGSQMKFFQSI